MIKFNGRKYFKNKVYIFFFLFGATAKKWKKQKNPCVYLFKFNLYGNSFGLKSREFLEVFQ